MNTTNAAPARRHPADESEQRQPTSGGRVAIHATAIGTMGQLTQQRGRHQGRVLVGIAGHVATASSDRASEGAGEVFGVVPICALRTLPAPVLVPAGSVARRPVGLAAGAAAVLASSVTTVWDALFHRLGIHETAEGSLFLRGLHPDSFRMVDELIRAHAPHVRIIATEPPRTADPQLPAVAGDFLRVDEDLVGQVLAIVPQGVRWILTSTFASDPMVYESMLHSSGRVVVLDDVVPEAATWSWPHRSDPSGMAPSIHEQLERIARAGWPETHASTTLTSLTAATVVEALTSTRPRHSDGAVVLAADRPGRGPDTVREPRALTLAPKGS